MSRVELGRPVIKQPVWTWQVPFYFFSGGLIGASAGLAFLAEAAGNDELARRAWAASLAGMTVSPALLISDLGRPERFLNMLRVFKPTSPMNMGTWMFTATGPAVAVSALEALGRGRRGPLGALARRMRGPARATRPLAAALGLPLATYTAALVADTAVPVWHEGRRLLPASFAGSAAASAGAAAVLSTPPAAAGPARRLAVLGAAVELAAAQAMERRQGDLGKPSRTGAAGRLGRGAKLLSAAGSGLVAGPARRSRPAAVAGGAMVIAGSVLFRWSVFRAGFQSAADPWATVTPQRERIRPSA
jgi:Polysulphide reductase, NrfD